MAKERDKEIKVSAAADEPIPFNRAEHDRSEHAKR